MNPSTSLRAELAFEGQMLRLWLETPPGNVLDIAMMTQLRQQFADAAKNPSLKAIVLAGQGKNFSYGASIPEHGPEQVASMLAAFHLLLLQVFDVGIPTLAVLRGRCLGGGLELACCCTILLASPETELGQPEIRLGVFAPAASVLLPWRLGGGRGLDLCVSGRTFGADEALRMGLVHQIDTDPMQAADRYFQQFLQPRSAVALRHAERAVRSGFRETLRARLTELERIYLDQLMATEDAREGIQAFLEKRPPRWKDC